MSETAALLEENGATIPDFPQRQVERFTLSMPSTHLMCTKGKCHIETPRRAERKDAMTRRLASISVRSTLDTMAGAGFCNNLAQLVCS